MQAWQEHTLAVVKDHQVAGVAVAMGIGKTLIGQQDMALLLPHWAPTGFGVMLF